MRTGARCYKFLCQLDPNQRHYKGLHNYDVDDGDDDNGKSAQEIALVCKRTAHAWLGICKRITIWELQRHVGYTIGMSVYLGYLLHYDVPNALQGFCVWTKEVLACGENVYFVLPNVHSSILDSQNSVQWHAGGDLGMAVLSVTVSPYPIQLRWNVGGWTKPNLLPIAAPYLFLPIRQSLTRNGQTRRKGNPKRRGSSLITVVPWLQLICLSGMNIINVMLLIWNGKRRFQAKNCPETKVIRCPMPTDGQKLLEEVQEMDLDVGGRYKKTRNTMFNINTDSTTGTSLLTKSKQLPAPAGH
jgi:hypothetical protein